MDAFEGQDIVSITGLVLRPDLNGHPALVLQKGVRKGEIRYQIQLVNGEKIWVKPTNLTKTPLHKERDYAALAAAAGKKGDINTALKFYDKALSQPFLTPEKRRSLLLNRAILYLNDDHEKGLQDVEAVLLETPDDPFPLHIKALALSRTDFQGAFALAEKVFGLLDTVQDPGIFIYFTFDFFYFLFWFLFVFLVSFFS